MKQVEKLAEEYYLNEYPGILDRYDSRFYEAGFYKAINLVIKYLESVDSGFRDEWFIDLKEIKNLADEEVE